VDWDFLGVRCNKIKAKKRELKASKTLPRIPGIYLKKKINRVIQSFSLFIKYHRFAQNTGFQND
jgi:hypothetical protein